jgi:hypothetical protein
MLLGLNVENWKKNPDFLVASGGSMFMVGFFEIGLLVERVVNTQAHDCRHTDNMLVVYSQSTFSLKGRDVG